MGIVSIYCSAQGPFGPFFWLKDGFSLGVWVAGCLCHIVWGLGSIPREQVGENTDRYKHRKKNGGFPHILHLLRSPFPGPLTETGRFLSESLMPMLLNSTVPALQSPEKGWEKWLQKKKEWKTFSVCIPSPKCNFTPNFAYFLNSQGVTFCPEILVLISRRKRLWWTYSFTPDG